MIAPAMSTNHTQIIHGMSNADYHAHPAISKSGLDLIRRAPAIYRDRKENPEPPTRDMIIGTITHTAVFEPDGLDQIVAAPEIDRRTTAGKAEWAEFQLAARGREVVTADEWEMIVGMRAAVLAQPSASKALSMIRQAQTPDGPVPEVEASIFWTDEETGVRCRCRPDAILANGTIIDLKTTRDASQEDFSRTILKRRYHVQAAFYSDGYKAVYGVEPKAFALIAVEKSRPYLCGFYPIRERAIALGRAAYQADLRRYAECLKTDTWPGLPDEPIWIDVPNYA